MRQKKKKPLKNVLLEACPQAPYSKRLSRRTSGTVRGGPDGRLRHPCYDSGQGTLPIPVLISLRCMCKSIKARFLGLVYKKKSLLPSAYSDENGRLKGFHLDLLHAGNENSHKDAA